MKKSNNLKIRQKTTGTVDSIKSNSKIKCLPMAFFPRNHKKPILLNSTFTKLKPTFK